MNEFNWQKVFTQYREGIDPYTPVYGRKYTLTHSDITAQLFVTIGKSFATDQINETRDEVKLGWVKGARGSWALYGEVLVDGEGIVEGAEIRNKIFLENMGLALSGICFGDRFMLERHRELLDAPISIQFKSTKEEFNRIYSFGKVRDYYR